MGNIWSKISLACTIFVSIPFLLSLFDLYKEIYAIFLMQFILIFWGMVFSIVAANKKGSKFIPILLIILNGLYFFVIISQRIFH